MDKPCCAFVNSTSKEERHYLNNVFDGKTTAYRFSAHDGFYEMYYPVAVDKRIVVLYLTDRQSYGKIGS